MKVYGGSVNTAVGQRRGVFCGTKKDLATVMGGRCIKPYLRDYWTETGNPVEVQIATSRPGVLFVYKDTHFPAQSSVDFVEYQR